MFRSVPGEVGQATIEFALVVPLVALTLLGIFALGRVVWAQSALENAVHEVARFAIVHGGTYMTTCPVGPDDLQRSCAGGGSPSTDNAKAVGRKWAVAAGDELTITVCYGSGCSGNVSVATNRPGTPVTVTGTSVLRLVVPQLASLIFGGTGAYSLSATTTMLVNT